MARLSALLIFTAGAFAALLLVALVPATLGLSHAPPPPRAGARGGAACAPCEAAPACPSPPPPPPPRVLPCAADPAAQPRRHVFFDIGTNDGSSIEQFLYGRGLLKADSGEAAERHRGVGLGERPQWHIIAVEANPRFAEPLRARCARYVAGGVAASCVVVAAALTTAEGNVTLSFDKPGGSLGSSIEAASRSVKAPAGAVAVRGMDVLTLFSEVFALRPQDFAIVKIDIEGSEYGVLNRAMVHGLCALWDEVRVEWHSRSEFVLGGTPEGLKAEATERCGGWARAGARGARARRACSPNRRARRGSRALPSPSSSPQLPH
jgi:FkbM family methyltransferase